MSKKISIFTDGGCHGNPGPGGWAFIVEGESGHLSCSGYHPETTNNRMELTAVIQALTWASLQGTESAISVTTDSQYVKNGITVWIFTWVKNGWRTSKKLPVKNQDLWMTLYDLTKKIDVDWSWTRGHSGHHYNELCDSLVQEAIHKKIEFSPPV